MAEKRKSETGNLFADRLSLYQSANSSNEAIRNNFVVRKAEFEIIRDTLKGKKPGASLQHELILGRRGSGKSTLLKRLQIEIEENESLTKNYVAINLAEEQAGIYRLFDLWLEVIKELGIKWGKAISLRNFKEFENDNAYTRYLYNEIHNRLEEKKIRVVLLLDNLDRILENFYDDAHLLRETLLNYNEIQIIGGSTRMNEHFWRYDKPFYDFFRVHRLEALTSEEIYGLLNHWSVAMDLPMLATFAQQNPGKIEAIRILTDGLPRTLQFFIQILLQENTLYGFDYIRKVMDQVSPLYQERLNNLPAAQRKIVQEMAFIWEGCNVKQLAEKCRMESKLVSAQLKQLSNSGVVDTLTTNKKNHYYRISERFFNIWIIVTQGNPEQKRKAKWMTIFLETWYDEEQIKRLAQGHLGKLYAGEVASDKALVLTKALSHSKFISSLVRDNMLDLTLEIARKSGIQESELPPKTNQILDSLVELTKSENIEHIFEIIDESYEGEDGFKDFAKGYVCFLLNEEKLSFQFYVKAATKHFEDGLLGIIITFYIKNKNKQLTQKLLGLVINGIPLNLVPAILWSGFGLNNLEEIRKALLRNMEFDFTDFLSRLLIHQQFQILEKLFSDPEFGEELKGKYLILYYAYQEITGKGDEQALIIPPETKSTVESVVKRIREDQAFYSQPSEETMIDILGITDKQIPENL